MEWCVYMCDINKSWNVTPHIDLIQCLLMHCWCYVLMLCLQRVMKRVSWMAFWRRCSLALLSGEREGHAKQVLIHKQTSKCSQNMQMFQSILYYLIYRLQFPFTHHLYYPETCVAYETHFFHLPLPLCLYVSVNTQQQICLCPPVSVPSAAWLRDCGFGSMLWSWLRGGKGKSTNDWHNNKRRGRVLRVHVGSRILRRRTTGEGVVVELEKRNMNVELRRINQSVGRKFKEVGSVSGQHILTTG